MAYNMRMMGACLRNTRQKSLPLDVAGSRMRVLGAQSMAAMDLP